uniref:Endo-1,4-beta-xylanase n=1 Tax=uncultured bacterium contig00160 TaxID=1181593 RepID=A0A806K216_9BACT|nr:endo-1,4-beta-xylanase C precursor [uncultured bacterium contig00160]
MIEYYIVDDWFGTGIIGPSTIGSSATKKGEFVVDGATYFIYEATRTSQPSIDGTQTFKQFFSIRQTRRQAGVISITEHFKKWESLGMKLGNNMYEAKFKVEVGGGTGSFDSTFITFQQK